MLCGRHHYYLCFTKNRGTERLSSVPKITELGNGRAGREEVGQNLCPGPLCPGPLCHPASSFSNRPQGASDPILQSPTPEVREPSSILSSPLAANASPNPSYLTSEMSLTSRSILPLTTLVLARISWQNPETISASSLISLKSDPHPTSKDLSRYKCVVALDWALTN